jgi:hypothetical protein
MPGLKFWALLACLTVPLVAYPQTNVPRVDCGEKAHLRSRRSTLPSSVEFTNKTTPKINARRAREVVLADFVSRDGSNYFLAPFLLYRDGTYIPLPDGTASNAAARLAPPTTRVDPNSPSFIAAKAQSILNNVRTFDVFRQGKRVGCFSVTSVDIAPVGPVGSLMAVGRGTALGFQPGPGSVPMAGPVNHAGFWPSTALSSAQQKQLLSQSLAMIPTRVPAEWGGKSQGQPILAPELVGKPIIVETRPVSAEVFRFKRGGNTSVFLEVMVEMKTSLGPFASADISLLDNYDETSHSWKRVLTCRARWELQAFASWDNGCSLMDVLDINGDGVAELILRRRHDEIGDIEIYELSGGQLRLVFRIPGWTGS